MAYDWFVVPIVASDSADQAPKYNDQIDSYSGIWHSFSADAYSDLPWYPNDMFVIRFYADDATLDAIYSNDDAWALYRDPDVTEADVAEYLNDVNNRDLTFSEWEQRYLVV